jgi:excisionase family DNA binding protein
MNNILLSPIPLTEFRELLSEVVRGEFNLSYKPKEHEEPEELLNSSQTAKLLCVSKVTLHKWKLEGKVKSYRIGTRIRFKRAEVLEALQTIKTNRRG